MVRYRFNQSYSGDPEDWSHGLKAQVLRLSDPSNVKKRRESELWPDGLCYGLSNHRENFTLLLLGVAGITFSSRNSPGVIELYSYRSGTISTGQYRPQPGHGIASRRDPLE
jgi:hypothetical protein